MFVFLLGSALASADETTDIRIESAKTNIKKLHEYFKNDYYFTRLSAVKLSFIEGALIPLIGSDILPTPNGETTWIFYDTRLEITIKTKTLIINWSKRVRSVQIRDKSITIPEDFTWSQITFTNEIKALLFQVFSKLEVPYFTAAKADAEFILSLPNLERMGNKSPIVERENLRAEVEIDPKITGTLLFKDLKIGNWILHPASGWVEVESTTSADGGTLRVYYESQKIGESRTIRILTGQEALVFAAEYSPAADLLVQKRASVLFPFEHVAMVLAHSILYDRVVKKKIIYTEALSHIFKESGNNSAKFSQFLTDLKNKILHRGIGHEISYVEELAVIQNIAQVLFVTSGEDIIQSGALKSVEKSRNGRDWFYQKALTDDIIHDNIETIGSRQLKRITRDVSEHFVTLAWNRGRHALEKNSRENANTNFLTTFGTYFPPKHEKHDTDPMTLAIRALKVFSSYDVARFMMRTYRTNIERDFRPDSEDIVTFVPSNSSRGNEMPTRLIAEAFTTEFESVGLKPAIEIFRDNPHLDIVPHKYLSSMSSKIYHMSERYLASETIPGKVRGKRVILVDDIINSGSIVAEMRRQLMDAGAREVRVIVLAKSETPQLGKDVRKKKEDYSPEKLIVALQKSQGAFGTTNLKNAIDKLGVVANPSEISENFLKDLTGKTSKLNIKARSTERISKFKNSYFGSFLITRDINTLQEEDWTTLYQNASTQPPEAFLEALLNALWEDGKILKMSESTFLNLESKVQMVLSQHSSNSKVIAWGQHFKKTFKICRKFNVIKKNQNLTTELDAFMSHLLILQATEGDAKVQDYFIGEFGEAAATSRLNGNKKLILLDEGRLATFEGFLKLDFSIDFLTLQQRVSYLLELKLAQKNQVTAENWLLDRMEALSLSDPSARDYEVYLNGFNSLQKVSAKNLTKLHKLQSFFEGAGFSGCVEICSCVILKSKK